MDVIHRDDLHRGGFAGLRETRMVMDERVFKGHSESGTWNGIGNFVYLADAKFLPNGETKLHSHREIDVISVMVEGRIYHEGSLEHGQQMDSRHAQAQRAGGEGFSHNEVNPDDAENRMIQLWVLPERAGDRASYKLYTPAAGELTRIYGGPAEQDETLDSHTLIDVGLLSAGQEIRIAGPSIGYVTRGAGLIEGESIVDGDLFRGKHLEFSAVESTQLIVIHTF